ncbi:MAG TPA: hypothetical protein IGS37_11485 [Synechococcales cyanobacterium M55_K2018_004]|nr:hypothetical protein [Synechococcales cyanobacterium M55_K2018_004]
MLTLKDSDKNNLTNFFVHSRSAEPLDVPCAARMEQQGVGGTAPGAVPPTSLNQNWRYVNRFNLVSILSQKNGFALCKIIGSINVSSVRGHALHAPLKQG